MSPAEVVEPAPAKVNLTLHVVGRRDDGYHLLDSVIVFAGIGDVLRARRGRRLEFAVTGPQAAALAGLPDEQNLVVRAARVLAAAAGRRAGAAIALDKRLPVTAGLGGGSADAAAALRALARLWRLGLDEGTLQRLAAGLGADVPACLACRPLTVGGVGDVVTPLDGAWPPAHLVLANPGLPLATAAVFAAREGPYRPADPLARVPGTAAGLAAALAARRNDLEAPARRLMPAIGRVLDALAARPGCLLARMSGSGATCFGLFAERAAADAAAAALRRAHRGWWVVAAALLSGPPEEGALSDRRGPRGRRAPRPGG